MRSYSLLSRHSGNASLFRAVELSLVSSLAGCPLHLHAEGLRGTGKTTILRSARSVLPAIVRIKGCPFNCDPHSPHCPEHRDVLPSELAALGTEEIPMPFCEISHSAKVGTVAGSIDLGRLTAPERPAAALLPGTLARAHRGIVLVDEINRLADTSPELTDLLLDAMGTRPGRLQIEETGLPTVELPLRVTVWAASNPDEEPGALEDIRRQLADRFDLQVTTGKPRSRETVVEILEAADIDAWGRGFRAGARPADPSGRPPPAVGRAGGRGPGEPSEVAAVFASRAGELSGVRVGEATRRAVAELYLDCGLESLRTVEAVQVCVRAACALDGRAEANLGDLRGVLPLVLGRRVDQAVLERFLARLSGDALPRPAAGARQEPLANDAPGGGRMPFRDGQAAAPGAVDSGGQAVKAGAPAGDAGETPGDKGGPSQPAAGRTSMREVRGLGGIFGRLARVFRGPSAEPQAVAARRDRGPVRSGRGAGGSGAGSIVDPEAMTVLAPPAVARPLGEIPAELVLRAGTTDDRG